MKSTPPIRLLSAFLLMLSASCAAFASPSAEPHLLLDAQLSSAAAAPAPLHAPPRVREEQERPLYLSQDLDDSSPPLVSDAIQSLPQFKQTPIEAEPANLLLSALRGLWLLTASLLALHLLREWLRVIRIRVHRPTRTHAMEHARWPTISILIPARGSAAEQIGRLAALPGLEFDYPTERIHFVPMFDPAETSVAEAVAALSQHCAGRIHPLPMMAGPNTTLAAALHAAVANSIGSALLVLDQELPLAPDWLRKSVTPLLDPAVGCVLTRAVLTPVDGALSARLDLLADQADTLLASQNDALNLLLCGKARIRALRRQAVKSLQTPDLLQAPDGASLVLALTRLGWQSGLLGEITHYNEADSPDLIRSPRLHPGIALQSMGLISLLLDPRIPAGARRQGAAAFFSAALPLIWLASLLCGIGLYFSGAALQAGLAIALCTACSFDPHGNPGPAFRIAAAARMAGAREEIRLLPLTWLGFTHRLIDGMRQLAFSRREARREHDRSPQPPPVLASAGARHS
jgi:hypothetical protein